MKWLHELYCEVTIGYHPRCAYIGTYASMAAHEASCGAPAAAPPGGARSTIAAEHDARIRRLDARIAEEHGAEEVRCV